MTVHLVAAPDADVADTTLPLIRDADGQFARAYDCAERAMFVVRPDGYLGYAAAHVDAENLAAQLRSTFTDKRTSSDSRPMVGLSETPAAVGEGTLPE